MSNLLNQPFDGSVLSRLQSRNGIHDKMRNGGIDAKGNQARRLSSWATVSVEGGPSISTTQAGFEERYRKSDRRPQPPSLSRIVIRRATGTAEKINLSVEIEVEFEVYTYEDFLSYSTVYLRRSPDRKPLTIKWGNVDSYEGRGKGSHTITGILVIGGGFRRVEGRQNVYRCFFRAIAPGESILQLDSFQLGDTLPFSPGDKFKYSRVLFTGTEGVTSIPEQIMFDLQSSGQDLTKSFSDGYEPTSRSVIPGTPMGKIYQPFDGSPAGDASVVGWFSRTFNVGQEESTGQDSDAVEYISLEYLVELVNLTIVKAASKRTSNQFNLKIKFADLHYSYFPALYKSGNPLNVLLLGGGGGVYKSSDFPSRGKDFEESGGYFTSCKQGSKVDHKKILISRRAAINSLIQAMSEYKDEKKDARKDSKYADVSDVKQRALSVETLFNDIFQIIARATGYYVNLSFAYPKSVGQDKTSGQSIEIIDGSYVTGQTQIWKVRPITGDGNSLRVDLDGKMPSDLVALSFIPGSGAGSQTSLEYSEDGAGRTAIENQKGILNSKLTHRSTNDVPAGVYAKIADSSFGEAEMQAACAALADYRNLEKPTGWGGGTGFTEFFDINLSVTMEGVFPLIIGNRITSEGLPAFATTSKGWSFVVLEVVDTIEAPNNWTTEVRARLCHT